MQLNSPCGPVKVLFTCVNIPPVISGLTIIPSDIMATMDAKVVSNSWENVQDDGRQNGTLLNAAQCPIQNGQICVYVRTIFCRFRPHRDPTYHFGPIAVRIRNLGNPLTEPRLPSAARCLSTPGHRTYSPWSASWDALPIHTKTQRIGLLAVLVRCIGG